MKFSCSAQELAEAVFYVQKAVMTKTSMQILEGILLKAQDGYLNLTGYDLEIAIITKIPADVEDEGEIILNAKILFEITRKIQNETVRFEVGGDLNCHISSVNLKYMIMGMESKEYPEIVKPETSYVKQLRCDVLRDMIKKTIFSVATSDIRVIHKGIKFEIRPGSLRLVAIDSHRIAIRNEFMEAQEEKDFVVPAKTMRELLNLLPDSEESVSFALDETRIMFNVNDYVIISRLLEGDFMKYESIIPTSFKNITTVDTAELISCIERVSLVINERYKAPLKLDFCDGCVRMSAQTGLGEASDVIEAGSFDGEQIVIGMSSKYMTEALRACEADEVSVKLIGATSPILITPTEGDEFLYLILPVRLNG